jgi:hypothetical protein
MIVLTMLFGTAIKHLLLQEHVYEETHFAKFRSS